MKNFLKSLFLIILGLALFYGNSVFALDEPIFETLEPEILENGIVRFQGQFDSRDTIYTDDIPETLFEFGDDINNLDFRSQRRERPQGRYIVSQGATRFQQGIQYYVRAVVRYGGDVQRGEIISFDPYKTTPVIFPSENIIQQPTPTNQISLNSVSIQNNINNGSNSQTNTVGSTIESLPAPSFNLLDFSQFRFPSSRNRSNDNDTESETISDNDANDSSIDDSETGNENSSSGDNNNLEPDDQSVLSGSNFENSASNSNGTNEIIRERGRDIQVNNSNNQGRSKQSASIANSGVRTTFPAYLALITVLAMVIISVILFRITHKKRKRLHRGNSTMQIPAEQYNPNNGAYAQYNQNKKPE